MNSQKMIEELLYGTRRKCSQGVQKYPLTNISYDEDTHLIFIEVAAAGFSKEDINMKIEEGRLYIKGKMAQEDESDSIKYVQKDIATRDFERVIALHERYINGHVTASFENGLLTISIEPSESYSNVIEFSD